MTLFADLSDFQLDLADVDAIQHRHAFEIQSFRREILGEFTRAEFATALLAELTNALHR
jgi:hypothetical protein